MSPVRAVRAGAGRWAAALTSPRERRHCGRCRDKEDADAAVESLLGRLQDRALLVGGRPAARRRGDGASRTGGRRGHRLRLYRPARGAADGAGRPGHRGPRSGSGGATGAAAETAGRYPSATGPPTPSFAGSSAGSSRTGSTARASTPSTTSATSSSARRSTARGGGWGASTAPTCRAATRALAREIENEPRERPIEAYMVPRAEQREEIGSDAYHGGVVYPQHASLHPGLYHLGILARTEAAGARVVTRCRVEAVERDGDAFHRAHRAQEPARARRGGGDQRLHRPPEPLAPPAGHSDRQLRDRDRADRRQPDAGAVSQGPGGERQPQGGLLLPGEPRPATDPVRRAGRAQGDGIPP